MFERYITKQDICDKWAKFKVGDNVANIKECQFNLTPDANSSARGVLGVGTILKVESVLTEIKPLEITLSELNDYKVRNRENAFSYKLKDEHNNEFILDECVLVLKKTNDAEFKKALEESKCINTSEAIYNFALFVSILGLIVSGIFAIILFSIYYTPKVIVFPIIFSIISIVITIFHPEGRNPRLRKKKMESRYVY